MTSRMSGEQRTKRTAAMDRRAFLKRSLTFGVGTTLGAGLLTGCWPFGDDDEDAEDDDEATPTAEPTSQPEPTEIVLATPEPTPTPDLTPTTEPTPVGPQQGGTLTIGIPADPFSLHPNADETTTNWVVMTQIHDALIEVDHNFEIVPVLAESYDVAEDGSQVLFMIHSEVPFHNGEMLTAEDVRYTHEWMRNPENAPGRSFYYDRVERIEAPDESTVVFHMAQPDGTLLRRAASAYVVNAAYHETVGANGHSLEPIGTGAFRLDDWVRGTRLALTAFEEHFRGRPYVDSVEFRVISDPGARANELDNGGIDIAFDFPGDLSRELAESDGVHTIRVPALDCNHIALNTQRPPLDERDVRLAMLYTIDRQQLVDDVFDGEAIAATSYLSPAVEPWHEPMIEADRRLLERASALLDEAGWLMGDDGVRQRDGDRLSFNCHVPERSDRRFQEGELISEMLAEAGIEMSIEAGPVGDHVEQMRAGELDAALFNWTYGGWRGEPDARTTLQTGAFNNFSQYANAQLDFMLVDGVSTVADDMRRDIYVRVQEVVADRAPLLFLLFPYEYYHFGSRVHGMPDEALWGLRALRLVNEMWVFDG